MSTDNTQSQQNGRVTMAVLDNKIDNLTGKVDAIHADQERLWQAHVGLHREQEKRVRVVEMVAHAPDPCQERIRAVELDQRELKTTVRNATGLNALYTTIAATLAGIFGK